MLNLYGVALQGNNCHHVIKPTKDFPLTGGYTAVVDPGISLWLAYVENVKAGSQSGVLMLETRGGKKGEEEIAWWVVEILGSVTIPPNPTNLLAPSRYHPTRRTYDNCWQS